MHMTSEHRKIIHIDMDAFYASVEERDFPEYRARPIVVGGHPEQRGVVATANYKAREFGVHSAMSTRKAIHLCPDLIVVKPRFDVYKEVSMHIRSIFKRYTDLIEPLSLDEAYLDVSCDKLGLNSAIKVAKCIKEDIYNELKLTASAGVSINKFVAKLASDYKKPNGLTFISPDSVEVFLEQMAIEKFYGVGKVTQKKMNNMGIYFGKDLKAKSLEELIHAFGKTGGFYYQIVRGIDDRPISPDREIKSISVEDTFLEDIASLALLLEKLDELCDLLEYRLQQKDKKGRTITLKIKFSDFQTITRSATVEGLLHKKEELFLLASSLLKQVSLEDKKVRLLGVGLSNFYDNQQSLQLRLF